MRLMHPAHDLALLEQVVRGDVIEVLVDRRAEHAEHHRVGPAAVVRRQQDPALRSIDSRKRSRPSNCQCLLHLLAAEVAGMTRFATRHQKSCGTAE